MSGWNTCIKALKNWEISAKRGREKKEKKTNIQIEIYRPKEGNQKKFIKKKKLFRPTDPCFGTYM